MLVLITGAAVLITRRYSVGRFGATSGAVKFNEEEVCIIISCLHLPVLLKKIKVSENCTLFRANTSRF